MNNFTSLQLGVAFGRMVRELECAMLGKSESASGNLVVGCLHALVGELCRSPQELRNEVRKPEEAAEVLYNWIYIIVDRKTDLPKDLSKERALSLYADLRLYFGALLESPFSNAGT